MTFESWFKSIINNIVWLGSDKTKINHQDVVKKVLELAEK